MSLKLYSHPLASYCWKVLLALYENDTPFEALEVNLGDPASAAAFKRIWPVGKFPVLRDEARSELVPESSIIIEYLATYYRGSIELIPSDADGALETRLCDRFYDSYVSDPMQKIVADRLRAPSDKDPYGVRLAHAQLDLAYGMIENDMRTREWAAGAHFSMADCSAAPALYYANRVHPFTEAHPHVRAYLDRLLARASFQRVLAEAEPFFHLFPGE